MHSACKLADFQSFGELETSFNLIKLSLFLCFKGFFQSFEARQYLTNASSYHLELVQSAENIFLKKPGKE